MGIDSTLVDLRVIQGAAQLSQAVQGRISHKGDEPCHGAETVHRVVARIVPDLDVNLRQRLFGLCAVVQDTQGDAEEFRGCVVMKRLERGPVALGHTQDQIRDSAARQNFPICLAY